MNLDLNAMNLFGDNISLKQVFLDTIRPVGSVYVQYPQQDSPQDLFNGDGVASTWQEINYDGAFFRASGGNAASYIDKTKVLVKQSQATRKNGLSLTGGVWGNEQTTSGDQGAHQHNYTYTKIQADTPTEADLEWGDPWYFSGATGITPENQGHHTHTFTPSVSHNLGIDDGDVETRPSNYTIKVWKRTA